MKSNLVSWFDVEALPVYTRGYGGGKLLLLNESKFYLGWTKVVADSREVTALRYMHGFSSAACVANR